MEKETIAAIFILSACSSGGLSATQNEVVVQSKWHCSNKRTGDSFNNVTHWSKWRNCDEGPEGTTKEDDREETLGARLAATRSQERTN
jgi:hypothetical protein